MDKRGWHGGAGGSGRLHHGRAGHFPGTALKAVADPAGRSGSGLPGFDPTPAGDPDPGSYPRHTARVLGAGPVLRTDRARIQKQ